MMLYRIALFISLVLAFPVLLSAQNTMAISTASVAAGSEATLSISISNAQSFVAFQADVAIPAGVTYIPGSAVLSDLRKTGHSLSASLIPGDTLRLLGFSLNNSAFKGNSGAVLTFKVKALAAPGILPVLLSHAIIGTLLYFRPCRMVTDAFQAPFPRILPSDACGTDILIPLSEI